jgi:hypothetical protein
LLRASGRNPVGVVIGERICLKGVGCKTVVMFAEKRKMGLNGGRTKPKNMIFRAAKCMIDGPDEYTRTIKRGFVISAIIGLCIVVPMQTFVWGPMEQKTKAAQTAVAGKSTATAIDSVAIKRGMSDLKSKGAKE